MEEVKKTKAFETGFEKKNEVGEPTETRILSDGGNKEKIVQIKKYKSGNVKSSIVSVKKGRKVLFDKRKK